MGAKRAKKVQYSRTGMPRERSSGCREALQTPRSANTVPLAHQKTEVEGRGPVPEAPGHVDGLES